MEKYKLPLLTQDDLTTYFGSVAHARAPRMPKWGKRFGEWVGRFFR